MVAVSPRDHKGAQVLCFLKDCSAIIDGCVEVAPTGLRVKNWEKDEKVR